MPKTRNGETEIYFESFGDVGLPTVLLINGLGSQLTRWPEPFMDLLNQAGYRAIRFDNRDVGLSTHFPEDARYTLADMAADAAAVLDAVGVDAAHVAGVSMGGMIAQRFAIDHPARTRSLTSIMSASGAPGTLNSTPEAALVLSVPAPDPRQDEEAFVAHSLKNAKTIGSPGFPWPEDILLGRIKGDWRRAYNPSGPARQMAAIRGDGDRTAALKDLAVPTVVLHGRQDPLVPLAGGESTAAAIPGAELRVIEGMGHDLPPALYPVIIDAIVSAARRAG